MTRGSVKNTRLPPAPVLFCPSMNFSRSDSYSLNTTVEALYTAMGVPTEAKVSSKPISEIELCVHDMDHALFIGSNIIRLLRKELKGLNTFSSFKQTA
ncbi:hypothetical protein CHS0354_015188 [Potamilus streckersoni]|uniref:Uncharacterized protein n=1 Tax=Potamilus streckersoni TaxID=2493646 RepID=A0AAE0VUI7_9BIVA|nr:hypothetical protein CHS0354_015188 [Potamilus streckersoni]